MVSVNGKGQMHLFILVNEYSTYSSYGEMIDMLYKQHLDHYFHMDLLVWTCSISNSNNIHLTASHFRRIHNDRLPFVMGRQ